MAIFKNAKINGELTDFEVVDGKFSYIGKTDKEGIDLNGYDVFPGLIEIHCHGGMGTDAYDCFSEMEKLNSFMAENGITSWYPTIGSMPKKQREETLNKDFSNIKGANILGFHMEGPYISGDALGSGGGENIATPENTKIPCLEKVKLINIAPEVDGALEFIKENSKNIRFAMGHTKADYDLSVKAIEMGVDSITHAFNAMPPLHHRAPGPLGAAIDNDLYVQVIADGIHLHKSVVKALYRIFGKKMILVSDATVCMGLPDGEYIIHGNIKRFVKDRAIRTEEGNLAGSSFSLYEIVKSAINMGLPREDMFYAASSAPASYMGINKGFIKEGYDADFIVVDDNNNLLKTFIAGNEYIK